MANINETITHNAVIFLVIFAIITAIMFALIIATRIDMDNMKRRYKRMMSDSDGDSLEELFTKHSATVKKVESEQELMREELLRIGDFIENAITRVGIVRFNAFNDEEAELSYCVALLDDNNNGVIISAITGRELTRSYAKQIEGGICKEYKLTREEDQALQNAINTAGLKRRKIID